MQRSFASLKMTEAGWSQSSKSAVDKNSAPHPPAPASDSARTPQTPPPDQTSSRAPRSRSNARPAISIQPAQPASSHTHPASSKADQETHNQRRIPLLPIAAMTSQPRPSRS